MFQSAFELCDVVSVCLFNQDNGQILMTGAPNTSSASSSAGSLNLKKTCDSLYRFPCLKAANDEWMKTAVDLTIGLAGKASFKGVMSLLKLYKVWVPMHAQKYVYHVVFLMNVRPKKRVLGNMYKWMDVSGIKQVFEAGELFSADIWHMVCNIKKPLSEAQVLNKSHEQIVNEIVESNVIPSVNNTLANNLELFKLAEMNRNEQIMLYKDFVLSSFPYVHINFTKFAITVLDLMPEWTLTDCVDLYRTADISGQGELTYADYILIFAVCDGATPHIGRSAEIRCRYIFRFFDRESKNRLTLDQFKSLLQHIHKARKMPGDRASTVEEEMEHYKVSIGISDQKPLSLTNFMLAAGNLQLRGTGSVLRFTHSYRDYLHKKGLLIINKTADVDAKSSIFSVKNLALSSPYMTKATTINYNQKPTTYQLAMHTILMGQYGKYMEVAPMGAKTTWISQSTTNIFGSMLKKTSFDKFNKKSPSNEIIGALKFFSNAAPANNTACVNKPAYSWGNFDLNGFATALLMVCQKAKQLFQSDPRLVELDAPVYVLGDIHGNYMDLMYFEKALWPLSPTLFPGKLLFLGDYVDRGRFGVEVVAYLLAYKVHLPQKITLLRGNHEIRDIQKMFTFYKECQEKFGDALGTDVWTAINNVFDVLPLAATIDGKIFCCHGGIPPPWQCPTLKEINKIPFPLPMPEEQSELAWNLMWNDPDKMLKGTSAVQKAKGSRSGFTPNTRRGTGFVFSSEALNNFLTTNQLTHVIRAHELQMSGASVQFDGKLLTVFSTSHYCSGNNAAACISVHDSRIRVLRMKIEYD